MNRQPLQTTAAPAASDWLAGGGEMGLLIRSLDWSTTPLGPIESWPRSLCTAVSICLGSRHPIALWWGPERAMFYNDAYRPMLGESKHPQFLGRSGAECWAEIWSIIGPMMDQVIETGEATWSEDLFLLMFRYGYLEETYFTFSYSPIRDEMGRPRGIFNACSESTARVLAERRLKTLREMAMETRTAAEAARLCTEVLEHNSREIPFALVYLRDDTDKRLYLAGQAGLGAGTPASPLDVEMTDPDSAGWPLVRVAIQGRPEMVGDLAGRFDCLPAQPWGEPAHQAMVLPIQRAGSQQAAGVLVLGVNPRRAFDDDYQGFFELVAGHVATAVANGRACEEERRRAEMLAELDRAKTTFFNNVSHEFRTPLMLMLGPLEEALDEADIPPIQRQRLDIAHRNSLRLLKLVNILLDFSRIEAGRIQATFEPVDLASFTTDLASVFRSAIEKAGMELVVECPTLPEPVYVDREMWEKIVLNLLSNAFKFTEQGRIRIRQAAVGDRLEMAVEDSGCGIPHDQLENVFKRFHRIEGTRGRTHEGTGIGLALVQELAKLHGGSVRVESVAGSGSIFTVSLPFGKKHLPVDQVVPESRHSVAGIRGDAYLADALLWSPDAVPLAQTVAGSMSNSAETGNGRPPRILLADDNADMREYVSRILAAHYEMDVVPDGEAALAAVRVRKPDLILSDIMMPGLDGFGLLQALRADPETSAVPVIFLSARAGEESRVEGLDAGADDYLVKPFSNRELLARVRSNLELARNRDEATRRKQEALDAIKLFEAVRESEERYRELVQNANSAIIRWKSDGTISFFNEYAQTFFGYRPDEVLGQQVGMLVPQQQSGGADLSGLIRDIVAHPEIYSNFENENICRDGRRVWMTWTNKPIFDENGQVSEILAIGSDVTERKRAEERKQRHIAVMSGINRIFQDAMHDHSEAELGEHCLAVAEEVTGSCFGFIGEIGPDGCLHDIAISNPGWEACRMIDQSGHRRPPGNFKLHGIYGRVLLDGKGFFTNHPDRHPDSIGLPPGHPPLNSFLGVPLVREGRTCGMIAVGNRPGGYCREVLESLESLAPVVVEVFLRKKAELALREREGRLRRAEEMAHLGHWRCDLTTGLFSWSDEMYRIFGLDRDGEQTERASDEIAVFCHPDDMEKCVSSLDPCGRHDGTSFEYRIMRPGGDVRHVVSKGEFVRDGYGTPVALFGTLLDTTELRQKERELQEKNTELERFTYMISHDMKSPLVTLKAFLGYLDKDMANNDSGRVEKDMHYIRSASDRMGRLLAEMLEMLRVGRMTNQSEAVACGEVIEEALNLVAGPIRQSGVEIVVDLPCITLFGDRPRLVEIWQNLLENACKFMGDQARPLIEIGAEGRGRETVFFVRDNGVGIEPKYQDKVFGLFEKLDRYSEGTGLGLALVRRIVELNGGRIRVESQGPGQGSCFRFSLPKAIKTN